MTPIAGEPARNSFARRNGEPLPAIVREQLAAARSTIQSYRGLAAYLAPFDRATLDLFEDIIAHIESARTMTAG